MAELRVANLSMRAGARLLVDNASLVLAPGELVVLLGPNGAGKSTLLRAALGLERRHGGFATCDGHDTARLSAAARARVVAYLPQVRPLAWPQSVRDVVALGRFAYGGAIGRFSPTDTAAVARALAACDLDTLADRATDTLSGGELARVHLARALAAETPLIVADEPVASLDPRHQHRVLALLRRFVAGGGGALVVLHDLDLAARHADRLVWMSDGKIAAHGSPAETLTADRIAEIYRVSARVLVDRAGRRVLIDGDA